ncbi:hypothetical protein [Niastella sp. OAS944]|uniref:hypothetical protein n=1 Tax=Niastella sp. OAS944 TaxID=2664089 RepID=UPI003484522F|nr:hypothetical protein [Chitinophagaceae bacterium OAS944]
MITVKERHNLQPINIAQEIADHNSVLLKAPVANILVGYMHSPQGVANDIVDLLKNPNRKNE